MSQASRSSRTSARAATPDAAARSPRPPQPSTASTTAAPPPVDQGYAVEGFSIALLGRQLHAMHQRAGRLQVLSGKVGRASGATNLIDRTWLHQRHAESALKACESSIAALEGAILTSRAVTVADAVVQLMIVAAHVDTIADCAEDECETLKSQMRPALESSLRVFALHHGVSLAEFAGRFYAATAVESWPHVDVSHEGASNGPDDGCLDGSGAGA